MTSILQFLKSLFAGTAPQRELDEAYLAQSADMHDLERRMREIDRRGRSAAHGLMLGLYVR